MRCRFCGAEIEPDKKEGVEIRRRDRKGLYIVQKGDTLWSICGERYKEVAQKNGLQPPSYLIYPGQVLEI